jgi:hypothetical protein
MISIVDAFNHQPSHQGHQDIKHLVMSLEALPKPETVSQLRMIAKIGQNRIPILARLYRLVPDHAGFYEIAKIICTILVS